MSHRFSRLTILVLAGLIPLAVALGWEQPTSASDGPLTCVDQIDESYQVPVTDPATHVDYPSTLEVDSAELDTTNPVDSSEQAPAGFIYLTVDMSSEPAQVQFGDPTWGDFYSNMAPLPAAALRYVTASGRSHVSTRVSVDTQASFANADGDDGLVDATYYFTIPVAHRNGTLEILPSRTSGMRYENFQGVETTTLATGGPTRIALHFPIPVAAAAKASATKTSSRDDPPFTTFASMLNFVTTILGASVGRPLSTSGFDGQGGDTSGVEGPSTSLTRDPRRVRPFKLRPASPQLLRLDLEVQNSFTANLTNAFTSTFSAVSRSRRLMVL